MQDLLVGAHVDEAGQTDEGIVRLFLGGQPSSAPSVQLGAVTASAGTLVRVTQAAFADVIPAEPYSCVVDWGEAGGQKTEIEPCTPVTLSLASHGYASAGSYTMRLTVTSRDQREGKAIANVEIRP
jgi:hypothetical protein